MSTDRIDDLCDPSRFLLPHTYWDDPDSWVVDILVLQDCQKFVNECFDSRDGMA